MSTNDIEIEFAGINPKDYYWLDIRIKTAHLPMGPSIPVDQHFTKNDAEFLKDASSMPQDKPWIVICDRGFRSQTLTHQLRAQGHPAVYSLIGGHGALPMDM